jgi:hypothetical protein
LDPIGPVVSEEKIKIKNAFPLFLFSATVAMLVGGFLAHLSRIQGFTCLIKYY